MKKKKDKGITIKYDAGDVESNIAFFNRAMGSNVGGDSSSQGSASTGVGEALNEEMKDSYYHGSLTLFKEFKSNITNWLSDDIDYSLIYASWGSRNGYIYYCRVDDLNLYDCGYTGTRVYSLMPIKPYKKTEAMLKILNGLNLSEKEQNDLLKEVAIEYNEWERQEGYNLRIDVVTRSDAFRKLLKSKGYDGVKAQERNQNTNKLCNTLGIFKASAIHIEKIDEVVKTGSGVELLPLEEDLMEEFVKPISEIIELPDFKDKREDFKISDDEIKSLEKQLKDNPNKGKVMQDCAGARKVRLSLESNNKGKSGGARVAYLIFYVADVIYLIDIILKSNQEDFTEKQKRRIRQIVALIKSGKL